MKEHLKLTAMDIAENDIREIFTEFYPRLCYYASTILDRNTLVDDTVQDAFLKLWQNRSEIKSRAAIQSYLYTVVRNNCLNILKHEKVVRKHEAELQGSVQPEISELKILEAEVLHRVYGALRALPEGCRKVIHLAYFEKMRSEEIAKTLKVSVNTVKTQKRRGLALLRTMVTRLLSFLPFV